MAKAPSSPLTKLSRAAVKSLKEAGKSQTASTRIHKKDTRVLGHGEVSTSREGSQGTPNTPELQTYLSVRSGFTKNAPDDLLKFAEKALADPKLPGRVSQALKKSHKIFGIPAASAQEILTDLKRYRAYFEATTAVAPHPSIRRVLQNDPNAKSIRALLASSSGISFAKIVGLQRASDALAGKGKAAKEILLGRQLLSGADFDLPPKILDKFKHVHNYSLYGVTPNEPVEGSWDSPLIHAVTALLKPVVPKEQARLFAEDWFDTALSKFSSSVLSRPVKYVGFRPGDAVPLRVLDPSTVTSTTKLKDVRSFATPAGMARAFREASIDQPFNQLVATDGTHIVDSVLNFSWDKEPAKNKAIMSEVLSLLSGGGDSKAYDKIDDDLAKLLKTVVDNPFSQTVRITSNPNDAALGRYSEIARDVWTIGNRQGQSGVQNVKAVPTFSYRMMRLLGKEAQGVAAAEEAVGASQMWGGETQRAASKRGAKVLGPTVNSPTASGAMLASKLHTYSHTVLAPGRRGGLYGTFDTDLAPYLPPDEVSKFFNTERSSEFVRSLVPFFERRGFSPEGSSALRIGDMLERALGKDAQRVFQNVPNAAMFSPFHRNKPMRDVLAKIISYYDAVPDIEKRTRSGLVEHVIQSLDNDFQTGALSDAARLNLRNLQLKSRWMPSARIKRSPQLNVFFDSLFGTNSEIPKLWPRKEELSAVMSYVQQLAEGKTPMALLGGLGLYFAGRKKFEPQDLAYMLSSALEHGRNPVDWSVFDDIYGVQPQEQELAHA